MKIKVCRLALLALVSFLVACSAPSGGPDWSHQFIVWDGDMYIISDDMIDESDLEMELGKVEKYSSRETNHENNDIVFSNHFSEGATIFKMIEVKESESLAIKQGEMITKLNNNGKYGK